MPDAGKDRPLEGIRVIEIGTWVALPGGCATLADWGAEVVKVEHPAGGDPARGWRLTPTPDGRAELAVMWEQDNRNKKSLALDVERPEGREVLRGLLATADVFATSQRPEHLEEMGLAYRDLSALNPRLVMVHLSGFGPRGPDHWRPGYDALCFWARSGFALTMATPEGEPVMSPPAVGDHTASLAIAGGVAAALLARARTGRGRLVQASLFHAGLWASSIDQVTAGITGREVGKLTRRSPVNPLSNSYATADGWIQLLNLQSDRFWAPFCRALERPDWLEDPRFATAEARAAHGLDLVALCEAEFARRPTAEWARRLDAEGVRWGHIQSVLAATRDRQAWDNGYFQRVAHTAAGALTLVTSPVQFDGTTEVLTQAAPELGQHTEELLLDAGYAWDDLARLKAEKVIL
jgi:crotonobetainyl-CoA:carnitine CoA-transferase CaiB-like acyl-CoA transferase